MEDLQGWFDCCQYDHMKVRTFGLSRFHCLFFHTQIRRQSTNDRRSISINDMAVNGTNTSGQVVNQRVYDALNRVRTTEPEEHLQPDLILISRAINHLWQRISAQPTSYTMSDAEFALFNFFQERFSTTTANNAIRQSAVARYWEGVHRRSAAR